MRLITHEGALEIVGREQPPGSGGKRVGGRRIGSIVIIPANELVFAKDAGLDQPLGVRLDGRGQIAGGDQIEDGAQVSVRVLVPVVPVSVRMAGRITGMIVVVHVHVDLGRPEDALHHLASLQRPPGKTELGELVAEGFEGHARVHEGAHDHVPRGPARAVEVRDAHLYRILLASLLIWLACAAAP